MHLLHPSQTLQEEIHQQAMKELNARPFVNLPSGIISKTRKISIRFFSRAREVECTNETLCVSPFTPWNA